jgi:predicted nucleic acid-binding protein
MSDKVFLDTNILVYAIESSGPDTKKSGIALSLVRRSDVCISTQVLGEFYRAVTSVRRLSPLSQDEATAWVQLWKRLEVCGISVLHVDLALEIVRRFQIGYYDALILAAARLSDCKQVYSEDLGDGQDYGGVTVANPFAENDH